MLLLLRCVFVSTCVSVDAFLPLQAERASASRQKKRNHGLNLWNPFAGPPEPSGSAVIDAVLANKPDALKASIVRKTDSVNERDSSGNNAMHLIARLGHYKFPPEPDSSIPKMLIAAKIDLNARNQDNRTALEISLLSGWQRIAYLLLESGADRSVVTQDVKSKITCPDCKRVVREYSL